jgi:hypothetical protein
LNPELERATAELGFDVVEAVAEVPVTLPVLAATEEEPVLAAAADLPVVLAVAVASPANAAQGFDMEAVTWSESDERAAV